MDRPLSLEVFPPPDDVSVLEGDTADAASVAAANPADRFIAGQTVHLDGGLWS